MWIKGATRKELLGIFQSDQPIELGNVQQTESVWPAYVPDELQLVWRENPIQRWTLPVAVILEEGRRRDFLAWVLTYLPDFRPFTAYCRVVDASTAERSLSRKDEPRLGKLQEACLGLILAEAATYLERRPSNLSPVACASTYSFPMARALALGILTADHDPISNSWYAGRNLTNQPRLSLAMDALQGPWAVVLSLSTGVPPSPRSILRTPPASIFDACLDLYRTGDIQPQQWDVLTRGFPEIRATKERMHGPREERVIAIEKSLPVLLNKRFNDATTVAFLCGYLASQVSPGTFDHSSLVAPHLQTFPTALLWYGLCAGLQERSNLQSYSVGLGRRVVRDVLRNENFLDRPHCDIALSELEVLSSAESQMADLRTGTPGRLEVEIAPCVTTVVRWPPRSEAVQESLPLRVQQEARYLLSELEETLGRLDSICRRLARLLASNEGPRSKSERKDRKVD